MKIKRFWDGSDDEINDWITGSNIEIIDIRFLIGVDGVDGVLILYKEAQS